MEFTLPQDESGYTSGYHVEGHIVGAGTSPTLEGEEIAVWVALSYAESESHTDAVYILDLDLARKLASALNEVCDDPEAHLDGNVREG